MKLFYREAGKGQPIIILHGLFGSSDNWMTVSKLFSEKYHVFLIDQRNHGNSPHSQSHNYADMANDLMEFITDHHIDNPYLIGHSMGGKTVMKFVITYKNIAKKMVIVDIGPKFYPVHHQKYIQALTSVDLKTLTSRMDADKTMTDIIPNVSERQFLLKNLYRDEDGSFHWRMNLEVLAKEIINVGEGLSEESRSDIQSLFIKGGNSDYYILKEDSAFILKLFPNSKIETISNAGHWVQAEKPLEFYNMVDTFFGD